MAVVPLINAVVKLQLFSIPKLLIDASTRDSNSRVC